uniref:Uncharacterized protein n=1 Tax=Leersia perrieri TaxID=77586 RepID=A0A0D9WAX8_9ORYZ
MVVRRLGGALLSMPNLRRRASNSWAAVRDTFFSTKEVFESHRVVFTVGTSIASVLTAWAGYSLRHMQQSRIDQRLNSIEQSLKNNHKVEHEEIKKIVTTSNISTPACVATALTTTVVGLSRISIKCYKYFVMLVCFRVAGWSLVRSESLPKRAAEADGPNQFTQQMALAAFQQTQKQTQKAPISV